MPLERLRIENVRCIERADAALHPQRNYVFGPNGAGKTSLLESIYLIGRGRSFRTRQTARLVRHTAAGLSVFGQIGAAAGNHRVGVGFQGGALDIRIDGQTAAGTAKLAAVMPVYVIDPKLHRLIEAGPSERRRYLDWGVFHVEHDYLETWRQYRRVLGQRNAALKTGGAGRTLDIWTGNLAELGGRIDALRRGYVESLAEYVEAIGARLLGSRLEVAYRPGWRKGIELPEALAEARERDLAFGSTHVGPHRGDLEVRIRGSLVRDEASRGQQKLVVAALVLGQVALLEARTGEAGVLLVDDPAAELDARSLSLLMDEIGGIEAQLVVTALSEGSLAPRPGCPVFHVEQGILQQVV